MTPSRHVTWLAREARYAAANYDGDGEPITLVERASSVLITAPHAVNHHRPDGTAKVADLATGSLAEIVAEATGHSVLTASRRVEPWAAWNERDDPFGRALATQLTRSDLGLVVDLHGMSDEHGVDLCIGLGPQPGDAESIIAEALQREFAELTVVRNAPFPARATSTITAHVQGRGLSAVQLEIARRWRRPEADAPRARRLLEGLEACLRHYS